MREVSTRGAAQGVGYNPMFAWARIRMQNGANPIVEHGLGISVVRSGSGQFTGTIDPGIRPPNWTAFVQTLAGTQLVLASQDEAAGTFLITGADATNDVVVSILVMGVGP